MYADKHSETMEKLLESLAKIGYDDEAAQAIVDAIAPIIFGTDDLEVV